MKRIYAALIAALAILGISVADAVDPMALVITNYTDVATIEFATDATYYQGDTITLSNSVMYTGSDTNSAVQNLDGCSITVRAGSPSDTGLVTTVTGYIVNTNTGQYGAEFVVPATDPCYVEVTVSNVAVRTYEQVKFKTRAHLGE